MCSLYKNKAVLWLCIKYVQNIIFDKIFIIQILQHFGHPLYFVFWSV